MVLCKNISFTYMSANMLYYCSVFKASPIFVHLHSDPPFIPLQSFIKLRYSYDLQALSDCGD